MREIVISERGPTNPETLRTFAREAERRGVLVKLEPAGLRAIADEIDGFRAALVEHHNMANISEAVLREYDFRECPVCKRARSRFHGTP